jgi:hypothetical protein
MAGTSQATITARDIIKNETPEEREERQRENIILKQNVKEHIPDAIGVAANLVIPGIGGVIAGGIIKGGVEGAIDAHHNRTNMLKGIAKGVTEGIPLVGDGIQLADNATRERSEYADFQKELKEFEASIKPQVPATDTEIENT